MSNYPFLSGFYKKLNFIQLQATWQTSCCWDAQQSTQHEPCLRHLSAVCIAFVVSQTSVMIHCVQQKPTGSNGCLHPPLPPSHALRKVTPRPSAGGVAVPVQTCTWTKIFLLQSKVKQTGRPLGHTGHRTLTAVLRRAVPMG